MKLSRAEIHTLPNRAHPGVDGVSDGLESSGWTWSPSTIVSDLHGFKTDPTRADTDRHGVTNFEETNFGTDGFQTDPRAADTDGIGVWGDGSSPPRQTPSIHGFSIGVRTRLPHSVHDPS